MDTRYKPQHKASLFDSTYPSKSTSTGYDASFTVSSDYRKSLPDVQNAPEHTIQGTAVPILQVGISEFKLPLKFSRKKDAPLTLEATVSGTVSLDAKSKGINMSRILRTVYTYQDRPLTPQCLQAIAKSLKEDLESDRAQLKITFNYPLIQTSLRSDLQAYQYYPAAYEVAVEPEGVVRTWVHMDFVYSSACPCSAELAEHAKATRSVYAIPHSQRSKARITVELEPSAELLSLEDLRSHALTALKTETQVLVKREDEQAFAEMNGAYVKFVEDAARLLYAELVDDERIRDFRIICIHMESIHPHNANAILSKGIPGGLPAECEDLGSLTC